MAALKPLDLIKTAKRLATAGDANRPRQADLKRAVSTTYYAMFHALCANCANTLIGTQGSARSIPAWVQAYRAINHREAKEKCKNQSVMKEFPKDIEDFGNRFITAQTKRHNADYDPTSSYTRSDVLNDILQTETVIRRFQKVPIKDRRAFAAWIALQKRI